jgi:SpoVK/Ycf46/Vps4 family AAA+-type ATPase
MKTKRRVKMATSARRESRRKRATYGNRIRPGLRILFTGSGTENKLLAGQALSERLRLELYRVDLSAVVSKYIGETEKNLDRLFNSAENKDWLLFFDEADALFGKRTQVKDSHDRYANQETAHLLQRLDVFAGPAIVALDRKGPLANVWRRRFPKVIPFPPRRSVRKHEE